MSRKVKSIKNESVDFDLFDIKEQISKSPKSSDVLMRESYIDIKRRRSPRKDMNQLLAEQEKNKEMVRKRLKNQQRKQEDEKEPVAEQENVVENVVEEEPVKKETKTTKKKKKRIIKK